MQWNSFKDEKNATATLWKTHPTNPSSILQPERGGALQILTTGVRCSPVSGSGGLPLQHHKLVHCLAVMIVSLSSQLRGKYLAIRGEIFGAQGFFKEYCFGA